MDPHRQAESAPGFSDGAAHRPWTAALPLRAVDVQAHRILDAGSGLLVCLMVTFSPWAFGTTQPWAIWTMNAAAYALGAMLACKQFIRHGRGFRPPRWGERKDQTPNGEPSSRAPWPRSLWKAVRGPWSLHILAANATPALAILTLLLLTFCFVSAANARATYLRAAQRFEYHDCLRWLPHSLDSARSWSAFWNYLAIACAFWATRDWLLGRSDAEERALRGRRQTETHFLPGRLRRLLWLLCLNGALLGFEGIAQRLEGSGKLLFLVTPRVNPDAVTQFGPWAYRANASSYFNLLWPVCLGFWWTLHRSRGFRGAGHHTLLLCAAVMAACPIISTSRGGALISLAILVLAVVFLLFTDVFLFASRLQSWRTRLLTYAVLLVFATSAITLGYRLGWKSLAPRLDAFQEGIAGREEMFDNARPMAQQYPLFGTGPGTFESVFQLYRKSTETYWPAQLHNDWLETRITFGWTGLVLITLALLFVVLRWFAHGGIHGGRRFITLAWLALAGCLTHALLDFPFQIYSILFLFTTLCAVLSTLSRRP